jgi:hypothetical protein
MLQITAAQSTHVCVCGQVFKEPSNVSRSAEVSTYRIEVWGRLDESWSDWLDGVTIAFGGHSDGRGTTVLTASLDQAALRGVVNRIWDLNLTLLSVSRRELPQAVSKELA